MSKNFTENKAAPPPAPAKEVNTGTCVLGPTLHFKGELYGEEDVIIEGRLEGKITLKGHGVIVEESGRIDGDIAAATICVAGEVRGNLEGVEQVVLLKTGRVVGDIFAKSVTLETGAQFKGSVDMDEIAAPKAVAPVSKDSGTTPNATKTNGVAHLTPAG